MLSTWMMNGAEPTLKSMRGLFHQDADSALEIFEYLEDAPLYEVVDVPGRRFLLTHSGLGHFSPDKRISDYSPDDLLWNRPSIKDAYFRKTLTVFGHTPTDYYGMENSGRMLKTDTWIDIDTGAANGGHPTLLRLDDERPFYVKQ